jgi:hypothetical protein
MNLGDVGDKTTGYLSDDKNFTAVVRKHLSQEKKAKVQFSCPFVLPWLYAHEG